MIIGQFRADEELHRHGIANLNRADALLFGRVTSRNHGGCLSAAGEDGSEAGLDGILRPDDRRGPKVYVVSEENPDLRSIGTEISGAEI